MGSEKDKTPLQEIMSDTPKPEKPAARKPTVRLTPDKWAIVQSYVCSGRPMAEVAEAFGISVSAIHARSNSEQWPTPLRLKRKKAALARDAKQEYPDQVTKDSAQEPDQSLSTPENDQIAHLATLARELLTVVRESPDRFDHCAGDFAQAMVAAGLAQVPAPRTISELAKWEQLRRQFKGLDQKGGQAGGLFDPFRPVRRATGNVVDAETPPTGDPLAGFEV